MPKFRGKFRGKISRRLGLALYPKYSKVISRRPYPPGQKKKRRPSAPSEYGKQVREKQKLRNLYNLREKQFRNYVKKILSKKRRTINADQSLIQTLELRLDNTVFRLGFAATREQARQMVSHGHFLVNGRKVTIPSNQLKKGDEVSLRPQSKNKVLFKEMGVKIKNFQPVSWIELDKTNLTGKIAKEPSLEEVMPPVEMSAIFEFYSR